MSERKQTTDLEQDQVESFIKEKRMQRFVQEKQEKDVSTPKLYI